MELDGWGRRRGIDSVPGMTLLDALRRPRYLLSAWPWRALAYLVTTVPIAGVLGGALFVVVLPAGVITDRVLDGRPVHPPAVVVLVLGLLIALALGPPLGALVGRAERARLPIADPRPLPRPRWSGLLARYTSADAWREVLLSLWLGLVVPVLYWFLFLLAVLDVVLILSPWLTDGTGTVAVGWATIDTPSQAAVGMAGGVVLLPLLLYVSGLLAAAQAAVVRSLLGRSPDGPVLREVNRSRARLVDAYETERRRIERDVHDGAQPRLTSLSLQLGLARLDVPDDSPAARPLEVAHAQARDLMVMLREIVHGIRPQSLTELGLPGAVRELAAESTVPVTVHADVPGPIPGTIETTAYFVVSECLANVARHSGAAGAEVRLDQSGGLLVGTVTDDGDGGADPARGTGLTGLADRVAAAGGRLELASPAGGPTVVRVELPCRS